MTQHTPPSAAAPAPASAPTHDAWAAPCAAPATASVGLVTLNAKYVHVALALRYLRNAAHDAGFTGTWLAEFTVRTPVWKMAAELTARRPRVLGFSVYIWNRQETLALIARLKKQDPTLLIVVGGPEVSFSTAPPSPYVDVVIAGEGERKWVECLQHWAAGRAPDAATRSRWATYGNDLPPLETLPYREADLAEVPRRLVYLETSRGCPYTCAFCLSALDRQVRFFPDAAVKAHITQLIAAGARRIKFLDRTFNLRRGRVRELFAWLMRFEGVAFHFEVVGDLLDDALLALLAQAPAGMFQFEVGIQSALPATQARIARRQQQERLFAVLRTLIAQERVHIHADLIWGLPGESLAEIRSSFEQVIALEPHALQLGFLKFLPGAPIRAAIAEHDYRFEDQPPYEVISHRSLSADELLFLKRFEEVFDRYYNSGAFRFTLRRLIAVRGAWTVFAALAAHFAAQGLLLPAHSLESLLRYLRDCAQGWLPAAELEDLLKLDYFYHHRARRVPGFLNDRAGTETATVRAARKAHPDSALAAFAHRIDIAAGQAHLERAPEPVWYAFHYSAAGDGYFFRPTLQRVE